MADYICIRCSDLGNCRWCSSFYQPDKKHTSCGRIWREHDSDQFGISRCPGEQA